MHIDSDSPIRLPQGVDVCISTTTANSHTVAPLDYETFIPDPVDDSVTLKCYDGSGTVVCITLTQRLLLEAACGLLTEPGGDRARRS